MESHCVVLFISIAVFAQYKYHLMPKPAAQPVPTPRAIFKRFEDNVKRDVEQGLKTCTHAQFKIRRVVEQPAHRQLVQQALAPYNCGDFTFDIDETETEFVITLKETPASLVEGDDDTIVPESREATPSVTDEEKKGWFY